MNRSKVLWICFLLLGFANAQVTQTLNFRVSGADRETRIYIPEQIDNPPIVFFLHGAGGNGPNFANYIKADGVADREHFIAVYPSGKGGNWDYGDGSDDFDFFLALIDTLDNRYQIDRNRIYASGFSMGGGMTFALGCEYSHVFAAIAPVSAAGTACTPENKIPVLITFGTRDLYPTERFMESLTRWAEFNECPSTAEITSPYPESNGESVVTQISYGPCAEGAYVVADSIHNGGHDWPTNTRTSINQAEEAWAFFRQFTLSDSNSTFTARGEDNGAISAFYSSGMIHLTRKLNRSRIRIMDVQGRVIKDLSNGAHSISFSGKPPGVYMLLLNQSQLVKVVVP